jgi:L-amino acid N-acyltransferase YncA
VHAAAATAHRAGPPPNEASNTFHRSFGFRDAGSYRRVAWMQLDLPETGGPDGPPDPIL